MSTAKGDDSTSCEMTEQRVRELRNAVERVLESDRRRIQSGELNPSDLFWISEDDAKRARVRWPDNYRAKV